MKGKELQELRLSLGLSQDEFGKKLGLSKSSICNMEKGERNISIRTINLIKLTFDVDSKKKFNIAEIRKLKGLTRQDLGNLVGLSSVAIGRYENGQREPDKKTIEKIADALNVHPSEIMGWKNDSAEAKNDFIKMICFIQQNLNKNNLFDLIVKENDENVYLCWKGTNDIFATIYVSAIEEIIEKGY